MLRRPGQGLIKASESVIAVGETISLTCTATDGGSPEAEFRWFTPSTDSSVEHRAATLIIQHATLADNGEYKCIPFNKIGDGTAGFFVLQVGE